jgi:hypothetical protein
MWSWILRQLRGRRSSGRELPAKGFRALNSCTSGSVPKEPHAPIGDGLLGGGGNAVQYGFKLV